MKKDTFAKYGFLGLALAVGIGSACSDRGAPDNGTSDDRAADDLARHLQSEIDIAVAQSALTSSQVRPVRPLLKCVERLSSSTYRAHFGYSNSSSGSISIPVGFYNRFYPNPSNRGQRTSFAPGSQADVIQVSFASNSSIAWILGTTFQIAVKSSKACPATGGTGGAAGAGGAGGKGGAVGTGGVGGTGGSGGAGGAGGSTQTCPSTCDDHNPCTTDFCGAATSFQCANVVVQDGASCSDGNACTTGDQCVSGVCAAGAPRICVASDQCHVAGVCNSATGACSNPLAADGASCSDANACTLGDVCLAGACASGAPKACAPTDQCHLPGACAPATGICSNPLAANGTTCNDGNMCTAVDTCQAGVCTAGAVIPPTHCMGGALCDACSADNCIPSSAGCDDIADPTDRQLCEDAYGCFTNPAYACVVMGDPLLCWCGSNADTCQTDNSSPTRANGPCLDAVIAAAHLTLATYDASTIKLRLVDPDYPLGRAANLTICRGGYCPLECGVP